jgi:formylglycine-generating enzyme required for sulfatase activity
MANTVRSAFMNIIYILISIISCVTTSCSSQTKATPEQQQIINQAKANFVFVKGGTFVMGNRNVQHATEHQVTLDSYSISKYETTFKEFDIYSELNEKEKLASYYRDLKGFGQNYGAKWMNWHQAKAYCQWLGTQFNLPIDLPTEAQWEYAARSRGLNIEHATDSGKIEGGGK